MKFNRLFKSKFFFWGGRVKKNSLTFCLLCFSRNKKKNKNKKHGPGIIRRKQDGVSVSLKVGLDVYQSTWTWIQLVFGSLKRMFLVAL
jgi:hypothetical protein